MDARNDMMETLRGKRFALVGFSPTETAKIIAALGQVRAFGHEIGVSPAHPALHSVRLFDVSIVNTSALADETTYSSQMITAGSGKPILLIGEPEDFFRLELVATFRHDLLLRPWEAEELLIRAFRELRNSAAGGESIRVSANGRPRVVVADDDHTTTTLTAAVLKSADLRCEVAHTGAEALRMVRQLRPDLLMLDLSLPDVEGFEVLAELRKDSSTRDLPVVMLTADKRENAIVRGFELGVQDYIVKPFGPREMLARVRRALGKARAG
jgi:CheY-like chemotaxis protein